VVGDVQDLEDLAVEHLRGFAGGLAVLHERREPLDEVGPPVVAALVQVGVGQHVVEKDLVRHGRGPLVRGPGLVGEIDIPQEKIGLQGSQVPLGHVHEQERDGLAPFGAGADDGVEPLVAVLAREAEALDQAVAVFGRDQGDGVVHARPWLGGGRRRGA
jgi:hypothetical protein